MLWWDSCKTGTAPALLVQVIAVTAGGAIVALAKLPDPSTSLQHHLLRDCHHNAEEVGILKRLWNVRKDGV